MAWSWFVRTATLPWSCSRPRRSRRIFTWRSLPKIASKSKLSIARLWRRVAKTTVRLVCARNTTGITAQLSSSARTGTTSKCLPRTRDVIGKSRQVAPQSPRMRRNPNLWLPPPRAGMPLAATRRTSNTGPQTTPAAPLHITRVSSAVSNTYLTSPHVCRSGGPPRTQSLRISETESVGACRFRPDGPNAGDVTSPRY